MIVIKRISLIYFENQINIIEEVSLLAEAQAISLVNDDKPTIFEPP